MGYNSIQQLIIHYYMIFCKIMLRDKKNYRKCLWLKSNKQWRLNYADLYVVCKKIVKVSKVWKYKVFQNNKFYWKDCTSIYFLLGFFCGITDYKLEIKPRQQVHYNSNLNSKMISNFNKYLLPFLYNSSH